MEEIKITHLKPNSQRIETWIALINDEVVGHIYMEKEPGDRIKFLDAWVHEDHRRKGIFRLYGRLDGITSLKTIKVI